MLTWTVTLVLSCIIKFIYTSVTVHRYFYLIGNLLLVQQHFIPIKIQLLHGVYIGLYINN